MKIKYFDLIALGGIHTGINIALLKIFMMSFKGYSQVDFYAEPEHSSICKKNWTGDAVNFHSMRLIPRKLFGAGGKMILRDALSCFYVFLAFLKTSKKDILVFSLAYPFAQTLIYGLSIISQRKNIYVCLHGEMEVIIDDRPFKSKNYQLLTKFVLKQNSNIRYIVFGESIYQNLKHLFSISSKVIVIDHPYEFEDNHSQTSTNFHPLVIGQIGMGEKSKGSELLFELAKLLKNEINENRLRIKLIGKLNSQLIPLDNGLVEYHTEFLSEEIFKKEIESLHFTLQLVPISTRKVTASGSFFDTIKYQKPYLSIENEYISYFHSKQPQSGIIFNSINEMAIYIKEIVLNENKQFESQYQIAVKAILELQSALSLSNIAKSLKIQI